MYINAPLLRALHTGETSVFLKNAKYKLSLTEQELGKLYLPTGKIVANDPLCLFETAPFTRAVRPGSYPVKLFVLQIDTDRRVAFAQLRFTENVPERFEMAVTCAQDIGKLSGDEFYGYGVDSGTGAFMDAETCTQLQALFNQNDLEWTPLDEALQKSYIHTYSVANVCLPDSACNVAAFSSGYGDGCYPSYWGLDKQGNVCCLTTDFCTIE